MLVVAIIAALALAAVALVVPVRLRGGSADTATPTSASMEQRWGIRFTQIGMSADGGMVDVRYVVLDVDRASALATGVDTTPLLVEESSQRTIFAVAMKAHAHDLHVGGRYYLLYRNTNGLIAPGRRVTITLGGEQLEHVPVLGTREP